MLTFNTLNLHTIRFLLHILDYLRSIVCSPLAFQVSVSHMSDGTEIFKKRDLVFQRITSALTYW